METEKERESNGGSETERKSDREKAVAVYQDGRGCEGEESRGWARSMLPYGGWPERKGRKGGGGGGVSDTAKGELARESRRWGRKSIF